MTQVTSVTPLSYEHRQGCTTATLVDAHGNLVPHANVHVEQTSHAFGFGSIGFDLIDFANGAGSPERDEDLARRWLDLFNMATLPFYWSRFEPQPGNRDTERLLAAARWLKHRGVTVKGHPLLWHTLAPAWLMELGDTQAEAVMRARIGREVRDFAGVIDTWDAINEAVIMPDFVAEANAVTRLAQSKGRVEMVRMAFDSARAANPAARLAINDFDLSSDYERLISDCLEAGIRIDAIGLQTHMHQGYRGEAAVWDILERFARFGLPLQMTETSLVSGHTMPSDIVDLNDYSPDDWPSTEAGEERQADEVVRHYRTLFAHPSVESVTYWGLADTGAWLGAPSGLIRRDGSLKPAYHALRRLIKEEWWHTTSTVRTDETGRVRVEGYAGTYTLSHAGLDTEVSVSAGRDRHTRAVLTP